MPLHNASCICTGLEIGERIAVNRQFAFVTWGGWLIMQGWVAASMLAGQAPGAQHAAWCPERVADSGQIHVNVTYLETEPQFTIYVQYVERIMDCAAQKT
jgi:hypothetical protein